MLIKSKYTAAELAQNMSLDKLARMVHVARREALLANTYSATVNDLAGPAIAQKYKEIAALFEEAYALKSEQTAPTLH